MLAELRVTIDALSRRNTLPTASLVMHLRFTKLHKVRQPFLALNGTSVIQLSLERFIIMPGNDKY